MSKDSQAPMGSPLALPSAADAPPQQPGTMRHAVDSPSTTPEKASIPRPEAGAVPSPRQAHPTSIGLGLIQLVVENTQSPAAGPGAERANGAGEPEPRILGLYSPSHGLMVMDSSGALPGAEHGGKPFQTSPEQIASLLQQCQLLGSQGFPYLDLPRAAPPLPDPGPVAWYHAGVPVVGAPVLAGMGPQGLEGMGCPSFMGAPGAGAYPRYTKGAKGNGGAAHRAGVRRPLHSPGKRSPLDAAEYPEHQRGEGQGAADSAAASGSSGEGQAGTAASPSGGHRRGAADGAGIGGAEERRQGEAQEAGPQEGNQGRDIAGERLEALGEAGSEAGSEGEEDIEDLLSRLNPHAKEFVPPPSPAASSPSLPPSPATLLPTPFLLPAWHVPLEMHLHAPLGEAADLARPEGALSSQGEARTDGGAVERAQRKAEFLRFSRPPPHLQAPPHLQHSQQQQLQLQMHLQLQMQMQQLMSAGAFSGVRASSFRDGMVAQRPPFGTPGTDLVAAHGGEAGPVEGAGGGVGSSAGGGAGEGKPPSSKGWVRGTRSGKFNPEVSIQRTIYVSDLDQQVTEEQLAELFLECGQVVDCRICGDPNSVLRFAFVEFTEHKAAKRALQMAGTKMGSYPLRVLPSKTPIYPVNPRYLPKSDEERELCARTVYCTNIDRKVTQVDVKHFFESLCGEVSKLRLLGDYQHNTRIAFVEFYMAEDATAALSCSGAVLGSLPISTLWPLCKLPLPLLGLLLLLLLRAQGEPLEDSCEAPGAEAGGAALTQPHPTTQAGQHSGCEQAGQHSGCEQAGQHSGCETPGPLGDKKQMLRPPPDSSARGLHGGTKARRPAHT